MQIAVVKLDKDIKEIPLVISYKKKTLKDIRDFRPKRPWRGSPVVFVRGNKVAQVAMDFAQETGIWHVHFVASRDKYISIILAVQRPGTSEHRELGVEAEDCIYSGFAAYNDSQLLGREGSLGPFCGTWWSPDDSWLDVVDGKQQIDWSHAFVTSAQISISLLFYRYYDPDMGGKVRLHIWAKPSDCPGHLVSCQQSFGGAVTVTKCTNYFLYLFEPYSSVCMVAFTAKNKRFIEIKDISMSNAEQLRTHFASFHTNGPGTDLGVNRGDCHLSVRLSPDDRSISETVDISELEKGYLKGLQFLAVGSATATGSPGCHLNHVYARFSLQFAECKTEVLSSLQELWNQPNWKFTDSCGNLQLKFIPLLTTLKFELYNSDIQFYTFQWTSQCAPGNTFKLHMSVDIWDSAISQTITLSPKKWYSFSSGEKLLLKWTTSGNFVRLLTHLSPGGGGGGTRLHTHCPITFKYTAVGETEDNPDAPLQFLERLQLHRESNKCLFRLRTRFSFFVDNDVDTVLLLIDSVVDASNMTWTEAENFCRKQGRHLLDISSERILQELLRAATSGACEDILEPLFSASLAYIGLHNLNADVSKI